MFTTTVSAVFCDGCGELIDEGVSVCARCGAPRPRQPFFYALSLSKLVFFGATSSGLYLLWWFWSQWRAEAPNDGRWSTALKTFFSTIFFYAIARQVKEEAEKHGVVCRYSPAVLTAVMWAIVVTMQLSEQPQYLLPATLSLPVPFIPVQRAINRVNAATSGDRPRSWRRWQVVIAVVLGLVWVLAMVGLLLPDPASDPSSEGGDLAQMVPPALT